jgi:hypothetical protein
MSVGEQPLAKRVLPIIVVGSGALAAAFGGWEFGVSADHSNQEEHAKSANEARVCLGAINRFGGNNDKQPIVRFSELTPQELKGCYGDKPFKEAKDQGVVLDSISVTLPKASETQKIIDRESPQADDISIARRGILALTGAVFGGAFASAFLEKAQKRQRRRAVSHRISV